jgi:hypothetical protein
MTISILKQLLTFSIFTKQLTFYIDVDGTLLDPSLDKTFNQHFTNNQNQTINWYTTQKVNNLKLNYSLILNLIILKILGHNLILWTNRRPQNIPSTFQNLSLIMFLFNSYQFHSGLKSSNTQFQSNSIIIDNETKYCNLSKQSIHIQFETNTQPHHITNQYSI